MNWYTYCPWCNGSVSGDTADGALREVETHRRRHLVEAAQKMLKRPENKS